MRKIFIIALSAALLSSCGLYKNYERPADIKTENLYGQAQDGQDGLAALQWRQLFTDPTLQELIQHTLDNNADMKKAEINIKEMEEGLKCAKLAFIPSIAIAPSGTIGGGNVWNNGNSYSMDATKTYQLPLSASWQLGGLGGLTNTKKKAKVQLEQTRIAKLATQTALVAGVANLYYTLAMLDQQLAIAEQTHDNWKEMLEKSKRLYDAGQNNAAGLASTEANIYSIEANIVDLKHSIHSLQNTLTALSGETPHPITRQALSSWQAPAIIETGVPALLLERRPDVRLAEQALAATFYDKNIARSNFFPALNLTGQLSWTNSVTGLGILNPGALIWAGIASLMQPIFQNGRLIATYRVSKMEIEKAALTFQQTLVDAGTEVNTAMAKVQSAEAKKDIYAKQVEALTRAVDATQKLMLHSSQYNYLNVLTAQTSLLSCQMGEISNQMESVQATIELYQALGGGIE
ncbi:MAG: efflux transporter outer membrane subunit [Bacteroidaceae bacterium]|nr:efflux transporter outer membrane subunit [Bacteroidaceae bacterium]